LARNENLGASCKKNFFIRTLTKNNRIVHKTKNFQVNDQQKKVSSAIGMKRSLQTSELLQYRITHTVSKRADKMQQAIVEKDFKTFAELTMKDSNEMHAICLDTYPPCIYMNDISNNIVNLIHSYNDAVNDIKVYNNLQH